MLGAPKKLIIVSGEKESVYAELLSSLISLKDDNTETNKVVGIRDGSVEAVVWSENVYNDNKAQLGSSTKLIFIGKTKAADAVIPNIKYNPELKKYGVNVGWLSNKAAIFVKPSKLQNEKETYDTFFESYKKLVEKFDDSVADSGSLKKARHTDGIDVAFDKGIKAAVGLFGGLKNKITKEQPKEKTNIEGTDFFDFGAKMEAEREIPDQMYRYAVLKFYLKGLSEFMEIK